MQFSDYEARADGPSIKSRTQDGLEIDLEVSFQYSLKRESIYDLYMKFAD